MLDFLDLATISVILPDARLTDAGFGMAGPGMSRCIFLLKIWDIPASYVSLPEGKPFDDLNFA